MAGKFRREALDAQLLHGGGASGKTAVATTVIPVVAMGVG